VAGSLRGPFVLFGSVLLFVLRGPTLFTPPVVISDGPDVLIDQRTEALAVLTAAPVPTSADEVWRYSRIDSLDLASFGAPIPFLADSPGPSIPRVESATVAAAVVRTLNGAIVSINVTPAAVAAGLRVTGAAGASPELLTVPRADGGCPFVSLSIGNAPDVLCIEAPPRSVIEGPVIIEHHVTAAGSTVASRLSVKVGSTAELGVVERWTSDSLIVSLVVSATRIEIADGGHLRFVSIQQLSETVHQIAHQDLITSRDASLRSMAVALGGDYARLRTDATITGPGGSNELLAVYLSGGTQMHDFRTMQHHVAPRTTSDLLFKGGVQDSAASVYTGLIRIAKDARLTVANQTNRNLLLSPNARAESVPNLEIENNDVKCSHASAIGPVDEDQRYYLESRGVNPRAAEQLIVGGFFADLLLKLPIDGLAPALIAATAEKSTVGRTL
jgi:Fe-S cluster assembly protein SufD